MSHKTLRQAKKNGYRSGLEYELAEYLKKQGVGFRYEACKVEWEDLAYRTYCPDFILPNGIIIEAKGRFLASDRRKHLAIKQQHPNLDIRFVFSNSKSKLRKGAKMTYGEWCRKNDFRYYDRVIPEDWLKEKGNDKHINDFIKYIPPKKSKRRTK